MGDADTPHDHRAARLAAAGVMGASVGHELRNTLAVAESAIYLARKNLDDRERLTRNLDQAAGEIRKAQEVIGAVLALARGEAVRREAMDAARWIEGARCAAAVPGHVAFAVDVAPSNLTVAGDPVLLERVLVNLYRNAVEAIGARPQGSVSTRAWIEGARTCIAVEDDGPGLDPAVASRVFEALVTSKTCGTGLGLALCRTIVEAHGGRIEAAPGPRGGAAFTFWLPAG